MPVSYSYSVCECDAIPNTDPHRLTIAQRDSIANTLRDAFPNAVDIFVTVRHTVRLPVSDPLSEQVAVFTSTVAFDVTDSLNLDRLHGDVDPG